MSDNPIPLEMWPHERAALFQWNFTYGIRDQLEKFASSDDLETIMIGSVELNWLASDLTHAIVQKGCRDLSIIELSERLDYVERTHDGSIEGWY